MVTDFSKPLNLEIRHSLINSNFRIGVHYLAGGTTKS